MAQIQGNQLVYNEANGELTASGKGITAGATVTDFDFSASSGIFKTPTGAHTIAGSQTIAADKNITAATGTGAVDFSAATGTFKTSTGTNTLGGNVVISGSKTLTTGTGAATLNGDTTLATAKTLAVTDADKLTVGGKIVPQTLFVNVSLSATDVSRAVFVCDGAYQVTGVSEVHSTASTSGTLQVEVCTGTTAPGSGTNQLTGTVSLAGTANTVANGTLGTPTTTAAGNRIGIVIAGTMTNIVGGVVTITLKRV